MKRTIVLMFAVIAFLLVPAVAASELHWSVPPPRVPWPPIEEPIVPRPIPMSVGLEVLVEGRPLQTISHQGRTYLPVPYWGQEYEIRVWNHGPRRIVALVSVDGLSVITGRPASEEQPGYIVAAHGSVLIKGWRRDLDRVAAFGFEERSRSYASRMGYPEKIGVISLLAIEERTTRPWVELERKGTGAPAAQRAHDDVGGTGTGYGRDIDSHVQVVPFARSHNRRVVTIWYDTPQALRQAGVPVDRPWPRPVPGPWEFAPPPPR